MKRFFRTSGLPWLLATLAVIITLVFTILEVVGLSPGKYVPLESILGVAELAAWLLFWGDDAGSRTELYIWGFPIAAAFNGLVGWCVGKVLTLLIDARLGE
jgi:hypothetical protein